MKASSHIRFRSLGAVAAILAAPGVAVAQTAATASATGSTQASAAAEQTPVLGEVAVAAQRREENIQSVPIRVAAVSGSALEAAGVTDMADLPNVVPGPAPRSPQPS